MDFEAHDRRVIEEQESRIAALEAQLAERQAENERLKGDRDEAKAGWSGCASVLMDTRGELAKALSRTGAVNVKVKALEWDEAIHGGWVAIGAAGVYHVHVGYKHDTRFYFFTPPFAREPNEFCSERAAKAAAQADYERRIRSALEPAADHIADAGNMVEPAAPEERQEPVAWKDATGTELHKIILNYQKQGMIASGGRQAARAENYSEPLYTRPAEQAVTDAATNALMYLQTGFIECDRCGHEVETKTLDAVYELTAALAHKEVGR